MQIKQADSLKVTVLVDNVSDVTTAYARDFVKGPYEWVKNPPEVLGTIRSSNGFSALVDISTPKGNHRVLYDTGNAGDLLLRNMKLLNIEPNSIEEIVISHGHWDHMGGLVGLLSAIKESINIYVHPDMFNPRRYKARVGNTERIRDLPPVPDLDDIEENGGIARISREPVLIADDTLLISGEIPRETSYEKGLVGQQALKDGEWIDDSLLIDDRCLIASVSGKGIVVISGCSHAGIVNMTNESMRLTKTNHVYGIIGGFHLVGDVGMKTKSTIKDLEKIGPDIVVPAHCTGWDSQREIAKALPDSYAASSVGNQYNF